MGTTTNGDVEIHYWDSGDVGTDTIVFSHGFLMDHEMFEAQVAAFSDAHRCITWDQRGHGATDADGPFTFWDSADDLLSVMDACGVEQSDPWRDVAGRVRLTQGGL